MSYGLTPYDFVQQVFYMQEKVLLDFHPTDDKYKEVLMEANLVLQELQKEEDWLWLRETRNLGFVTTPPVFGHRDKDLHFGRRQHDFSYKMPDDVYKPSTLYGDCVRLCRWRVRHEAMDEFATFAIAHKEHWDKVFEGNVIEPDNTFIYYGAVTDSPVDVTGFEYGGTFPFSLGDLRYQHLPKYIKRGKWYLDRDGYMFAGDMETFSEDPDNVFDTETPYCIYMCEPADIEIPKREDLIHKIDPMFIEPAPHNFYEIFHLCCHHRYPYPMGLNVLWDTSRPEIWDFIEVFENDHIRVPYVSGGQMHHHNVQQTGRVLNVEQREPQLGAVVAGNKLTFTRPLLPWEMDRVIIMDVQKRIEQFHICDDNCTSKLTQLGGRKVKVSWPNNPCVDMMAQTDAKMLTEIPDPNYVVTRTAALHAEGSPSAQGRLAGLQDQSQKLLSAMRTNNADATAPDYLDWHPVHWVNIV